MNGLVRWLSSTHRHFSLSLVRASRRGLGAPSSLPSILCLASCDRLPLHVERSISPARSSGLIPFTNTDASHLVLAKERRVQILHCRRRYARPRHHDLHGRFGSASRNFRPGYPRLITRRRHILHAAFEGCPETSFFSQICEYKLFPGAICVYHSVIEIKPYLAFGY